MSKPKVFIASSTRALGLAAALKSWLADSKRFSDVFLWEEELKKTPGRSVIKAISSLAMKSDYLAVLLTQDDYAQKKDTQAKVPRDNCVFEAGLFTGALGFDTERCFLVSSLEGQYAIPSDLLGLIRIQFTEPGNLTDKEQCKKAIEGVAEDIGHAVATKGLYRQVPVPFVSDEELMERERDLKKSEGNAVVVNSVQPLETMDHERANVVLENIGDGLDYKYFFKADEINVTHVSNLLQTLAIANLLHKPLGSRARMIVLQRELSAVGANLKLLGANLNIHFRKRPPLQLCVHSAKSTADAACYLRYVEPRDKGDIFVRWHDHENAVAVARELASSCRLSCLDFAHYDSVFHSTTDFILDEETKFTLLLVNQIKRRFPKELHPQLMDVLFDKEFPESSP